MRAVYSTVFLFFAFPTRETSARLVIAPRLSFTPRTNAINNCRGRLLLLAIHELALESVMPDIIMS